MHVTLSHAEERLARHVALRRRVTSLRAGLSPRYGPRGNLLVLDRLGASGEVAAARALGLTYTPRLLAAGRKGDVHGVEVRTRSQEWHDLIVHPADADERPFVLVVLVDPWRVWRVVGWLPGAEAKRERWWRDPAGGRPAYFVPQRHLRPIETLRAQVGGRRA